MPIVKDPHFITSKGIKLDLEPIPPLIGVRWDIEYRKRNPPPEPPAREVKVVGVATKQLDTKDEYYQQQMAEWEMIKRDAEFIFMFSRGVKNKVPKDWQPDPDIMPEKPSEQFIKAMWVYEQIGADDLEKLPEAIASLTGITQAAIEEEEKK